jgi:hypothetical protein
MSVRLKKHDYWDDACRNMYSEDGVEQSVRMATKATSMKRQNYS